MSAANASRVSGTGFPLILVHGFTTTSEFWRNDGEIDYQNI
jgi:hypothetical protein